MLKSQRQEEKPVRSFTDLPGATDVVIRLSSTFRSTLGEQHHHQSNLSSENPGKIMSYMGPPPVVSDSLMNITRVTIPVIVEIPVVEWFFYQLINRHPPLYTADWFGLSIRFNFDEPSWWISPKDKCIKYLGLLKCCFGSEGKWYEVMPVDAPYWSAVWGKLQKHLLDHCHEYSRCTHSNLSEILNHACKGMLTFSVPLQSYRPEIEGWQSTATVAMIVKNLNYQ